MPETGDNYKNLTNAISKFTVGYNKGVVLTTVTARSMGIIDFNLQFMRESLESVVAAFEEIQATSGSATKNAEHISGMMDSVRQKSDEVNSGIAARETEAEQAADDAGEIDRMFRELAEKAQGIQNVTGQIQDVSDRTNILAINASIEAARAGEVGKGFRIIANEVRNLATQTGEFAQEIDTTISQFGESIETLTEKMTRFISLLENFRNDFREIKSAFQSTNQAVNETGQNLDMISGAIKEQNEALTDGLKSLESIFTTSRDSEAVVNALLKAHSALDSLLDRES